MIKPLLFFILILLSGFSRVESALHVSGKVWQTHEYCGGARPSPEMLERITTARPLANKKCYVRKGHVNNLKEPVVATFVSDTGGNFSVKLPPGNYCIIDEKKLNRDFVEEIARMHKKADEYNDAADLNCLKSWLTAPDAVFTVKKGENKIEVTYHFPCSWNSTPCVTYHG
ncbi:MAG TPA: hypothetical protein VNY73_06415, partial [Bacteroidia bacterium]|nr:hypothetical protein [Bacteroidia bacterium]